LIVSSFFFFQAEDGIRDFHVTGVQTCALPIYHRRHRRLPRLDRARQRRGLVRRQQEGARGIGGGGSRVAAVAVAAEVVDDGLPAAVDGLAGRRGGRAVARAPVQRGRGLPARQPRGRPAPRDT